MTKALSRIFLIQLPQKLNILAKFVNPAGGLQRNEGGEEEKKKEKEISGKYECLVPLIFYYEGSTTSSDWESPLGHDCYCNVTLYIVDIVERMVTFHCTHASAQRHSQYLSCESPSSCPL